MRTVRSSRPTWRRCSMTSPGGPGSAAVSALPPSSGGTGGRWPDWTSRSQSSSAGSGVSRDSRGSRSISGHAKERKPHLSLARALPSSNGFRWSQKPLQGQHRRTKERSHRFGDRRMLIAIPIRLMLQIEYGQALALVNNRDTQRGRQPSNLMSSWSGNAQRISSSSFPR